MSKYYVPTIEEIIYELTNVGELYMISDKENVAKIQTHPDLVNTLISFFQMNDTVATNHGIKYSVDPELYRIKYLDSDDIESLGFIECPSGTFFEKGDYQLYVDIHPVHNITIYDDYPRIIFQGTVKNKSKLKDVLKMLGI